MRVFERHAELIKIVSNPRILLHAPVPLIIKVFAYLVNCIDNWCVFYMNSFKVVSYVNADDVIYFVSTVYPIKTHMLFMRHWSFIIIFYSIFDIHLALFSDLMH